MRAFYLHLNKRQQRDYAMIQIGVLGESRIDYIATLLECSKPFLIENWEKYQKTIRKE